MDLLKYGIENFINGIERIFHVFMVAYFNVVFIPSAVNKVAFDQMQKMIKEKSSSQRSII